MPLLITPNCCEKNYPSFVLCNQQYVIELPIHKSTCSNAPLKCRKYVNITMSELLHREV